jgi:CRP/FNR family transcriptional regulator
LSDPGSKSFKKDSLIYIESDEDSSEVFVVETGEVGLTGTPGIPRFRTTLKTGDIFGFTSCLCRRPRMETAVARTDCSCAVLERERFIESVQSNPELASRIISYFAQELRAYDDLMTSPSEEASARDDEAHLYQLAQHLARKGRPAHAAHALRAYTSRFPAGMHVEEGTRQLAALEAKGAATPAPVTRGLCRVFADGQMIFCEHEPGNELYVIKSGKVEILKISPPDEILLSILRDGDIFGELSIVSTAPRNAAAVSSGESVLLPISRESLLSVFEKSPATVGRILGALSQRLWFTFIRLRAKVFENPLTRTYVLLENKLLEDRVSLLGTKPHTLGLGIAEILGMAGVPADQVEGVKNVLGSDPNFSFQFRQVTIDSPSALEAKARYFRTRDHLDSPELRGRKNPAARIGLDLHELRVPPGTIPEA